MKGEVMNLVEKVRELEMALCHANGKLNSIQDACEQEQDEWKEKRGRVARQP